MSLEATLCICESQRLNLIQALIRKGSVDRKQREPTYVRGFSSQSTHTHFILLKEKLWNIGRPTSFQPSAHGIRRARQNGHIEHTAKIPRKTCVD